MVQLSHLIFEIKNLGDEGELCFPSGSAVKSLPVMQELRVMWVRSLGREDPLEVKRLFSSSSLSAIRMISGVTDISLNNLDSSL